MKLIFSPAADFEFQFTCEPHTAHHKAAIDAIRNWYNVADLVLFAEARHGYENTDGFFGITYPNDLDEHDLANSDPIPNGYVEAHAWYGATGGEAHLLTELDYLKLLRQFLTVTNHLEMAHRVNELLAKYA